MHGASSAPLCSKHPTCGNHSVLIMRMSEKTIRLIFFFFHITSLILSYSLSNVPSSPLGRAFIVASHLNSLAACIRLISSALLHKIFYSFLLLFIPSHSRNSQAVAPLLLFTFFVCSPLAANWSL